MSSSSPNGDGNLLNAVRISKNVHHGNKAKGDGSNDSYRPKVEVKSRNSLYIISYSDIPPLLRSRSRSRSADDDEEILETGASQCREFNVSVYIDIPTIDYYNDELKDNKLSKFNRRFKLHLLRESIFQSFTNGNDQFWDQMMENASDNRLKKCTISISSSGSLRYVETTRFLIENCYEKLSKYVSSANVELKFKLEVTPTSHKWFTTFLNKQLIEMGLVEFIDLGSYSKISDSATTPFKEYYAQLNSKFGTLNQGNRRQENLDSIVIITNSTGVKALLTILSDRPLTSYILQESIDALHDNGLRKKDLNSTPVDSSEDETPLKRESSSLLSFQNSLLTSNKDKSVRIRSLSLNRRSNRVNVFQNEEPPLYKASTRDGISPTGSNNLLNNLCSKYSPTAKSKLADETKFEKDQDSDTENLDRTEKIGEDDHEEAEEEYEEEYEDEDEDEDDDENENDDDDEAGISFSVPSRLSRSGSYTDVTAGFTQSNSRRGRFRSLSLMDPAQKGPFTLDPSEDESAPTDRTKITNIYIHDGEFEELESGSKKNKNKLKKALLSRQNSGNGLIPPEFYSRISSPCTSASSSNSSLQNINMAPGTFSKWIGPESSAVISDSQNDNFHPLFEKNLINKSFEEVRNQSSMNLFSTLMGKSIHVDKNPLALNFKSNKTIPPEIRNLDEEDRLMSGYYNGNSNFDAEETSEDERRSNSTVILDKGMSKSDSQDIDRNDKPTGEQGGFSSSFRNLNLNLKLYDDDDDYNNDKQQQEELPITDGPITHEQGNDPPKPKYKKAISLDLYGDDDLDNAGGWILGGNAR